MTASLDSTSDTHAALEARLREAQQRCKAAAELLATGKVDDAEAMYQAALKAVPRHLPAMVGLGNVAWAAKVLPLAQKRFKTAAALHPQSARPLIRLVQLLHSQKRWADAEAVAANALALEADKLDVAVAVGRMRYDGGNFAGARAALELADGITPNDPSILFDLARTLIRLELFAEAEARYARCLEIAKPDQQLAVFKALAVLARKRGDPDRAMAMLNKAIALAPEDSGLAAELARAKVAIARVQGDGAAVLREVAAALELLPDDVHLRLEQASALGNAQRFDEAEACYRGILAGATDLEAALLGLGEIEIRRGRREQALGWFERAHAAHPKTAATRVELGSLLKDLGRLGEAETILRTVAAGDGSHPRAQSLLAEVGRKRAAKSAAIEKAKFAPPAPTPPAPATPAPVALTITAEEKPADPAVALPPVSTEIAATAAVTPKATPQSPQRPADPPPAIAADTAIVQPAAPTRARHIRIMPAAPQANGPAVAPPPTETTTVAPAPALAMQAGAAPKIAPPPSEAKPDARPPASRLDDGLRLAALGRTEDAFRGLEQACRAPASVARDFARSAAALGDAGDIDRAHALVQQGIERFPADLDLWFRRISLELAAGDLPAVERSLDAAPAATPAGRVRNLIQRARLSQARWALDDARTMAVAARELDPTSEAALHGVVHLSQLGFDLPAARREFDRNRRPPALWPEEPRQPASGPLRRLEQIHADLAAHPQLSGTLAALCRQNPWQRIVGFIETARRNPDSYSCAVALLIELRQSGFFDEPADTGSDPAPHPQPPIPRVLCQFQTETHHQDGGEERRAGWLLQHPTCRNVSFSQTSATEFLRAHAAPRVLQAFQATNDTVRRAELFRLAYLYARGGVSVDPALRCRGSIEPFLLPGKTFVTCQTRFGTIDDGLIAAAPNHPIIKRAIERVLSAIRNGDDSDDWTKSGGAHLSRALTNWVCETANGLDQHIPAIALIDVADAARLAARARRPSQH